MSHRQITRLIGASLLIACLPIMGGSHASAAADRAGSPFGANLIVNGNAESNPGSDNTNKDVAPSGWQVDGSLSALLYGADGGAPAATDPGPADRGKTMFAGGTSANQKDVQTARQTIDVSSAATVLDTGNVSFTLSGWLGGYSGQNDNAKLEARFLSSDGKVLGTTSIGPVLAEARKGATGLWQRAAGGHVSPGTRSIIVVLTMTRTEGSYNDGYADNLSLILAAPPSVAGTPTPGATTGQCGSAADAKPIAVTSPASGASVAAGSTIAFAWAPVPCAASYNVQVWLRSAAARQTLGTSSMTVVAARVSSTTYSLSTKRWLKGIYAWRLVAVDTHGSLSGKWSAEQVFTIR